MRGVPGAGPDLGTALAADTTSSAVLEILDDAVVPAVPGTLEADLSWRQGTPLPANTPAADIRIGYARCSALTQECSHNCADPR